MKTSVFVIRRRRVLQKVSVVKKEAATFILEIHREDEAAVSSETCVLSPHGMASYTWSYLSSLPNSFYNSGNGVSSHTLPQIISHVFLSNIM